MSIINLYTSCHVVANIDSDLIGGIEFLQPSPLPETINLHASSIIYFLDVENYLKGGTATEPGSLSDYDIGLDGLLGEVDSICAGYGNELIGFSNTLGEANSLLNSPFNLMRDELNNLVGQTATGQSEITGAVDDIDAAATSSVPPKPDTTRINNLLQNCGILENDLKTGKKSIDEYSDSYINEGNNILDKNVNTAVNNVMSLLETPTSVLINEINNILDNFNIGDLLSELDGIVNCMSGICGRNFDIPNTSLYVEGSTLTAKEIAEIEYNKCRQTVLSNLNLSEIDKFNALVACQEAYDAVPDLQDEQLKYAAWLDDYLAYVNSMLVDMGLDESGNFNSRSFTSEYPLEDGVEDNIDELSETIKEKTEEAQEQIEESSELLKESLNTILNPQPGITKTVNNYYT